ncbi:MAG: HPr-rel-A system PqqD family peptide chaperone [Pseudomonadota bacterium]
MTWIVSTAHPVLERRWGDEYILYDVDSGNTHLVTPLAADVLARLKAQPCDTDSLVLFFATDEEPSKLPEIRQTLATILDDLERIDLVRRLSA